MSQQTTYSSLFSTIHDEQEPVGHLGRGTHYSVLRSIEWLDVVRSPLINPQIHDFSIIWDVDHDTRIIQVLENIYMAGLLSPVQFIGERKGTLTLVVAAKFYFHGTGQPIEDYKINVQNIADSLNDPWPIEVGSFDRAPGDHQCFTEGLIAAKEHRVITYLKNIDSLWGLGTKEYNPNTSY